MTEIVQIKTDDTGLATAADEAGAENALAKANSIDVIDQESANAAAGFLKQLGEAEKALEARRKEITGPINQSLRSINDLFRGPADNIKKARTVVKGAISRWTAEEERKIAEERRLAEEKARKAREAAEAKAQKYEEEGREDMAEKWAGKAEEADAISQPVAEAPKVAGVAMRTNYDVQVQDSLALCQAVADGKVPPTVIKFNQAELNKFARAWKGKVEMPGCKIKVSKSAAG